MFNRSPEKVDDTVARAKAEGNLPVTGFKDLKEFVGSLKTPRRVIILVKAGAPVDATIASLAPLMEKGDIIIDGGNEWFENTERRAKEAAAKGLLYVGMGVSGGEEGARNGPSLMPGGPAEAYKAIEPIVQKVAAQVSDGPCVTHIGEGGSGNYVKMVHNGIEYGDMQLISEAYDILKSIGGLTNQELAEVFDEWNKGELESFLIEITAQIFKKKDDKGDGELVDKVLDKAGNKGTGRMTVQEFAERAVPAATIAAALDARFLSSLKSERMAASKIIKGPAEVEKFSGSKKELIEAVRAALYASKVCSYAQGLNLIRRTSDEQKWDINMGRLVRIWKGGCIIRCVFLDRIKAAYDRDANLASLLVDGEFAKELNERQASWRKIVALCATNGIPSPAFSGSLAYFDSYRRERLPANLLQAQRDFFGAHTYERTDMEGSFHTEWAK